MATKKSTKASDDKLANDYNKAFSEGLAIGDFFVTMLVKPEQAFIIPVNPYESERGDDTKTRWNGWRDGFDEAVQQFRDLEDIAMHEVLLELSKRYKRQ